MKFIETSFRHAKAIIESDELLKKRYEEFIRALTSISDDDLKKDYQEKRELHRSRNTNYKSLTPSINSLLKQKIKEISGWQCEVEIFNDKSNIINNTEWKLDFACEGTFAVEIAFNHGEAIPWNLLKLVLASELNHVDKRIQTQIGIYVCATDALKKMGNIDGSSGSYEKVLRYLPPLRNQLTIPIIIIGIKEPKTFFIDNKTREALPISTYTQSLNQTLIMIKKYLNSRNIEFTTSHCESKITDNKTKKQKFSIFCQHQKLGIYSKIQCEEIIKTMKNNNYHLVEIKDKLSYNEIRNLINDIEKYIDNQ